MLVQRVGHGDEHALARLYEVLAPLLLAWAKATGLDSCSCEDATCAAMVRLWRHAPAYDPHRERAGDWIISHVEPLRVEPAAIRSRHRAPQTYTASGGGGEQALGQD